MMTSGAAALLRLLSDEGVTHLFGNPGTTELPIMEALPDVPEIRYVLGLQEAVVLAMADAYARASGRLCAVNLHTSPGLGNAMGALYGAHFAGAPVIVTAGQQDQGHNLQEPILSGDPARMARPFTKWSVEATRVEDLPRIVRRAAKVALAPPAGPVFISLPSDVLRASAAIDMGASVRVDARNRPSDEALERLVLMLLSARRPAMIVGQEVAARDAMDEAGELAVLLGAAVYQQTMPSCASFVSQHPAHMGPLGRNQSRVRAALEPHDVVLCVGADLLRMSLASEVEPLPPNVAVAHVSERSWELGKNYRTELALQADVRETLRALVPMLRSRGGEGYAREASQRLAGLAPLNWASRRTAAAVEAEKGGREEPIDPRYLAFVLAETLPENVTVVEEAATTMEPLLSFVPMRDRASYFGLTSGALGFGLPWAVGAALALPGRPVVAVIGDGSAMYALPALWNAAKLRLPISFVIVNNGGYRVLKERVAPREGKRSFTGMELRDPRIDFAAVARGLGLRAVRIGDPRELKESFREAFASGIPNLIEVMVAGFES